MKYLWQLTVYTDCAKIFALKRMSKLSGERRKGNSAVFISLPFSMGLSLKPRKGPNTKGK